MLGQKRVDSSQASSGSGASVFIDRGAVDRADKDAPYAVLLNPVDFASATGVDPTGADRDQNSTVVHLSDSVIESFTIFLGDGQGPNAPFEGTGVNPLTVNNPANAAIAASAVQVEHDGKLLVQGVEYNLGYNPSTGVLMLTPLSTLWDPSGVYTIILNNLQIADLAGNALRSNQVDGTTKFFILMPDVRLDYGDAPDSFGTMLSSNGARHTIQPGATPILGSRIDGESDTAVSDDAAQAVLVTGESTTIFSVGATPDGSSLTVKPVTAVGGEVVTVTIGANTQTFELVASGFAPQLGNVAVPLLAGDTSVAIASRLATAISSKLVLEGNASRVVIDPTQSDRILLESYDDEDGVAIGQFGAKPYRIFLNPGAPEVTSDFKDALGFLNPLDELGTTMAISSVTGGILDAWIDFNNDGAFGVDEKIFNSVTLSTGVNYLKVVTPLNTADGTRWARFRISSQGGLGPTELAIGGEVEDYQVDIINVAPIIPGDDSYTVVEDSVLNTETNLVLPSLLANDPRPAAAFLPSRIIINSQPKYGTLTVTDPLTGRFVYTPAADFYGDDSFTYWVSTQPIPGTVLPPNVQLATVHISVTPDNDTPLAQNHTFPTLEDTSITITKADLIAGAIADASPVYPSASAPTAPWNESQQTFKVIAIKIGSTTLSSSATNVVGANGTFDLTFTAGELTRLVFKPNQDYNRDNPRTAGLPTLEAFEFTIQDSGESLAVNIDQSTGAFTIGGPIAERQRPIPRRHSSM